MSQSPNLYPIPDFGSFMFTQGFITYRLTATTMVVSPGSARSVANNWVIENPATGDNPAMYLDTSVRGAGGCYPSSIDAVTPVSGYQFAKLYAVGDSSGKNAPQVVLRTGDRFLPAGYDVFALVALVLIDTAGEIVNFTTNGIGQRRKVTLQDPIQILSLGNSTTAASITVTALPIAIIYNLELLYSYIPALATNKASLAPAGLTPAAEWPYEIQSATAGEVRGNLIIGPQSFAGAPSALYKVTDAGDSLSLWVSGFEYDVIALN